MYQIILDSSNTDLLVGLAKDNELIDVICYEAWQRQSEMMVSELDNIMKRNNVTRKDIDDIYCGIGPGSYTGVRISLTIAKTMSLALNIPVHAISSLHMMKDKDKPTICLINARSNRSYIGVFKGSEIIMKDCILTNDEVRAYINEHPDYSLSGDIAYLKLENKESIKANMALEMLTLKDVYQGQIDTLGLKPIYLKD